MNSLVLTRCIGRNGLIGIMQRYLLADLVGVASLLPIRSPIIEYNPTIPSRVPVWTTEGTIFFDSLGGMS